MSNSDNIDKLKSTIDTMSEEIELLKRTLDLCSDINIRIDANLNINYISRSITNILGFNQDTLINKNINELDFIFTSDSLNTIKNLLNNDNINYSITHQVTLKNINNEILHFNLLITNNININGIIIYNLLIKPNNTYISYIKTSNDDLQDLDYFKNKFYEYNKLYSDVDKLNHELLDKIEQSVYENKAKLDFIANISHELRTYLNGIIGHSDLRLLYIQNSSIDDFINSFREVKESGEHLLSITNDIFNIASAEAGKLQYKEDLFDIRDLLKFTINMVLLKAEQKRIKISYNIDEKIQRYLISDKAKLRQILVTLLSNIIKLTSSGNIIIDISLNDDLNTQEILFTIKNTSYFNNDSFNKIMLDSFDKLENGIINKYGSTGLSLALCKHLTDIIHGNLWLKESSEEGISLYISIPNKKNPTIQNIPLKYSFSNIDISNRKILIVDDDDININVVQSALEEMDTKILIAKNGKEAIKILNENEKIDLVLMDIMMTEMDGLATTKIIRTTDKIKNIPIIAFTALSRKEEIVKSFKAGCNDYLGKPFRISELISTINKWLD